MIAMVGNTVTYAGDYTSYTLETSDRPIHGKRHHDPNYGYGSLTPYADARELIEHTKPETVKNLSGNRNISPAVASTSPTRESLNWSAAPHFASPHGPTSRYIGGTY